MKNSSDTIGNRTRELPAYSEVPQPTAQPRTPFIRLLIMFIFEHFESRYNLATKILTVHLANRKHPCPSARIYRVTTTV